MIQRKNKNKLNKMDNNQLKMHNDAKKTKKNNLIAMVLVGVSLIILIFALLNSISKNVNLNEKEEKTTEEKLKEHKTMLDNMDAMGEASNYYQYRKELYVQKIAVDLLNGKEIDTTLLNKNSFHINLRHVNKHYENITYEELTWKMDSAYAVWILAIQYSTCRNKEDSIDVEKYSSFRMIQYETDWFLSTRRDTLIKENYGI